MGYYLLIYKSLLNYNEVDGWLPSGRIKEFSGRMTVGFGCPPP